MAACSGAVSLTPELEATVKPSTALPEPTAEPPTAQPVPTAEPAAAEPVEDGPRVGDLAPDFTLPEGNGNMVNLAEQLQNNEMVALVFYISSSCTDCFKQLDELEEDITKYEDRGVQLIALAVQDQVSADHIGSRTHYPILADANHVVAEAYNVYDLLAIAKLNAMPAVFLIDKDGQIVWAEFSETLDQLTESETILANLP
jgi:peroxiredoxin Q/BCP